MEHKGIIQQQEGQPQEQQPHAQPAPVAQQPGGDQATPEEQKAKDQVVMAGTQVLYEKDHDKIVDMLKQAQDKPDIIAQIAVMIIVGLDEKSGDTIPEDVILPAAAELTEQVAVMAQETGAFEVTEAMLGKAGQIMMVKMAEEYGPPNDEEIQGFMAGVSPEDMESMNAQQDGYANGP